MTTSADTMREIAELLFEGGAFEIEKIVKASPDGADLHVKTADKKKAHRRQAQVGLATNVVGITAGAAGTATAYKEFKNAKYGSPGKHTGEGKILSRTPGRLKPAVRLGSNPKFVAGSLLALQGTNLAGDAIANRVLARAAKKDPDVKGGTQTAVRTGKKKVEDTFTKSLFDKRFQPLSKDEYEELTKADDSEILWEGEFSKVDTDKRQVFGWASIVKKDGEDIVDLQGDYIDIDEIEKSAYDYVIKSRKGGNQHARAGEEPLHVSDMIESFIVTPEKIEKMGLPEDTPLGWWVGFKVNDDETWAQVKEGKRTGFSIHGRGRRVPA